jgi:hypothetical protein
MCLGLWRGGRIVPERPCHNNDKIQSAFDPARTAPAGRAVAQFFPIIAAKVIE